MKFDKYADDLPGAKKRGAPDKVKKTVTEIDVSLLTVEEILAFRAQLEAHLPARGLRDMDLAKELVIQVLALQVMQQKALEDEDTPVNQLAQAANSLSAALINLVKLQNDVYSSERFKKVEDVLIRLVQGMAPGMQEEFITAYEEALRDSV
jgi:hypothetical protein